MDMITFAVCTYNRAELLPGLVRAMCAQSTGNDFNYEVLIVNNNSTDDTQKVLERLADNCGDRLRECTTLTPFRNIQINLASG